MRGKKKRKKYFQWKEKGRSKRGKKAKGGKIIKLFILTTGSKSPHGSRRNEKGHRQARAEKRNK